MFSCFHSYLLTKQKIITSRPKSKKYNSEEPYWRLDPPNEVLARKDSLRSKKRRRRIKMEREREKKKAEMLRFKLAFYKEWERANKDQVFCACVCAHDLKKMYQLVIMPRAAGTSVCVPCGGPTPQKQNNNNNNNTLLHHRTHLPASGVRHNVAGS